MSKENQITENVIPVENSVTFQGTVGTITNLRTNIKITLNSKKQHYKNTRNNQFKNKTFRNTNKQINYVSSNDKNHSSGIFSEDYNLENDVLLNCITTKIQNDSETKT